MVILKKSYRKIIFREIKQSFSRFLAIFFIVALGVGFFAGLMATTPDMRLSADRYYDDTYMMDIRVVSTLGLTDDDVKEIRNMDGVSGVMPAYSTDALVNTEEEDSSVARIHGLPVGDLNDDNPDYLNRVTVTEGRLPEKQGECVLEEDVVGSRPVELGSTIRISPENKDDLSDTLADTEFTVVGYVKSAYYFSIERDQTTVGDGTIDLILYIDEKSFCMEAYSDIFLTVAQAKDENTFSQSYTDCIDAWKEKLEDLGSVRTVARYDEVKSEAQAELDDAQQEYDKNKEETEQKLQDAQQELEDGRAQIEQSEQELQDGFEQLTAGEQTIQEKEQELLPAQQQIEAAERTIQENEKELALGEAQWQEGNTALQQKESELSVARRQLEEGESALAAQESLLLQGENQWQQGKQELEDNRGQLEAFKQQLDSALQQIEEAKKLIEQLYQSGLTEQARALEEQVKQKEALYQENLALYQEKEALFLQAEQELETKRQELDAGRRQLEAGKQQLESSRTQLQEGEAQITAARAQLDATRAQLDDGKAQLEAGKEILAASNAQYEAGKQQWEEAKEQLSANRTQLEEGQEELESAKQKLADGEKEYQDGKQEADTQLGDAEEQLRDAQQQIDELTIPEWYVLDRNTNVSYASFDSNAQKVEAIAKVFPVFFFLVAALVALTTMTRMIEEERTQIGTLKALGYGKGAIALKYVVYAGIATIAGSVFGLLVGFQIFPVVIWKAYAIMYNLPPLITAFQVDYALVSSLAAICCTMLATFFACYSTLMETPARLMLPRAPKAGKRILLEHITPIWSRMRFTHKVTARNLIRYKKRFFMTVIGIAGCTALLLTGFGMRDSISDIIDKQFNDLFQYNLIVGVKDSEQLSSDPILRSVLDDPNVVSDSLSVHQEMADVTSESGDTQSSVYLYVPESSQRLPDFIKFRDRKSGASIPFTEDSVLVSEKMAESLHIKNGSTITIQNADGVKAECKVGGIVENYVYAYVYMSPDLYRSSYHAEPDFTQVIAKVPDTSKENREEIASTLLTSDDISAAQFTNDLSESFSDVIKNMDYIVIVLIVSAGLLAFIVLYNLTNINITERQKEIATIKVLGFYDKEVSAYIFRETAILTLIGAAVGLVLGIALHAFVVKTAEIDMVMFGRNISVLSYFLSALLTIVFSLLVNLVMYRKLKKISMVESMKAGE